MKKYLWTHTTNNKETTEKADTLESAIKTVIEIHHPKARFVCTDLQENDDSGDLFSVYFQDQGEIFEFEIATTTDGVVSLFNQLSELCRSYDRFDLTTTI